MFFRPFTVGNVRISFLLRLNNISFVYIHHKFLISLFIKDYLCVIYFIIFITHINLKLCSTYNIYSIVVFLSLAYFNMISSWHPFLLQMQLFHFHYAYMNSTVYCYVFIHLSVDEHLGWIHFISALSSITINTEVKYFCRMLTYSSLGIYTRMV